MKLLPMKILSIIGSSSKTREKLTISGQEVVAAVVSCRYTFFPL